MKCEVLLHMITFNTESTGSAKAKQPLATNMGGSTMVRFCVMYIVGSLLMQMGPAKMICLAVICTLVCTYYIGSGTTGHVRPLKFSPTRLLVIANSEAVLIF